MTGWRRSLPGAAALVIAVAAVAVAGGDHPLAAAPIGRSHVERVTAAALSCPGSPGWPAPDSSTVFAVGPDPTSGIAGDSRLDVVAQAPRGALGARELAAATGPGRPVRVPLSGIDAARGTRVLAVGGQAPGVSATQLSTYASTTATGITAGWCESARAEWWFSGVDTEVGTSTGLVLTNPGAAVAVVDLELLGAHGVVDAAGATGIAVAPRSRRVLDLARYAPGQAALTVRVTATRGTVTAAVGTTRLAGVTPAGADWVPASPVPERTVLVDPGVAGAGSQSLVVTNPGARQQLVSVRILDTTGPFTPTRLGQIQVPPGSVVVEDVHDILGTGAPAIELSAATPVTGALVSALPAGTRDFAVSGVSPALTTAAVAPLLLKATMSLSLANGSLAPQRVVVHGLSELGRTVGTATVVVPGLTTRGWRPPAGWAASYVVVTVRRGSDVHAVAGYVGDRGISQLPLLSGRRTLVRPAVVPRYP